MKHDPMKVIASTTRGALVAAEGHELIAVDFAGIESRVTAWMAGEHWKLAAFRKQDREGGPDNYQIAYGDIYGIDPATVTKKQRQKGKPIDLFGGYEGGVNAFVTMAGVYHVDLEELVNSVWDRIPQSVLDASRALYEKMGKRTTELPERIWLGLDSVKRMWRAKHPATVRLWRDMKDAAVLAVQNPGEVHSIPNKKVMFKVQEYKGKTWLYMRLPSGRRIAYFAPRVEYDTKWCPDCLGHYDVTEREDGSKHRTLKEGYRCDEELKDPEKRCPTCFHQTGDLSDGNWGTVPDEYTARVTYMGIDTKTRQWTRVSTYGGKLVENAVQAASRDLLVNSMFAVEAKGWPIVMTVHDELVLEVPIGACTLKEVGETMCELPKWAEGLPVAAEGWVGRRYRK